jgi:hypothetical protein
VLLAELEIWHSRPIAPTRRVAVGRSSLPVDPAPGFGGILLGGIVAAHIGELDPDLTGELSRLLDDLEIGRRIPQPRLRHRFQADRIGLARSRHRLLGQGDALAFAFDDHGAAASQILGACYAAGRLAGGVRSLGIDCVRRGVRWRRHGRWAPSPTPSNGPSRCSGSPTGHRPSAGTCSAASGISSARPTPTTAATGGRPPSASPS